MKALTASLETLIEEFRRLPGVGRRSAEKYAYYVMGVGTEEAMPLARAIRDVKQKLRSCKQCFAVSEGELCSVCSDPRRDASLICVVEQSKDLINIEQTHAYRGLYHVLLGRISPLEGIGPEDLTIASLIQRAQDPGVKEIVIATNPTVEGDATAGHIHELLKPAGKRISRIAKGISAGNSIEFVSSATLAEALSGRHEMK